MQSEGAEPSDHPAAPRTRRRLMVATLILLGVTLACLGHLVHRQYPNLTFYWSPFSARDVVDSVEPLFWEVQIGRNHLGVRWQ